MLLLRCCRCFQGDPTDMFEPFLAEDQHFIPQVQLHSTGGRQRCFDCPVGDLELLSFCIKWRSLATDSSLKVSCHRAMQHPRSRNFDDNLFNLLDDSRAAWDSPRSPNAKTSVLCIMSHGVECAVVALQAGHQLCRLTTNPFLQVIAARICFTVTR